MSNLGVFQVVTSWSKEDVPPGWHMHTMTPLLGERQRGNSQMHECSLGENSDQCCASTVSVLWINTHWSPIEGEHYTVLFDIVVALHIVRGHFCIWLPAGCNTGCVGAVVQSSGVCSMHCRKGLCSCWGGDMEMGTAAGFQETEHWDDLLKRTWVTAVSCEKSRRKVGLEERCKDGTMLETALRKGRQPQKGTVSLMLTPGWCRQLVHQCNVRETSVPYNLTTRGDGPVPGTGSVRGIINMSGAVSVGVPQDNSGCGCQK